MEQEFGKKIETDEGRPWPGAFAIVDERIVAVWLKMLEAINYVLKENLPEIRKTWRRGPRRPIS